MNSEMQHQQLPKISFSRLKLELVGTPEWIKVAEEVVQALENYGSFEVINDDENMMQVCQKVFKFAMRDLFSLPSETKSCSPGYLDKKIFGAPVESMAVFDATADGFHSFTNLMWPQGYPYFWYNGIKNSR
ncbi:Isopenicillin N synthase-like protein [Dioscorea alata]|uniref:Isopenicillin N synthase-like protein n=1 Tax=Dioscorea alata TaxID=55571 RepID=A0ACB7ULG1_DIOAL|nr:Isopenicillin N synthase-like protein [Dioscorea alata]